MPAPFQGWMYLKDQSGAPHEIFNHARTAAYLKNPALSMSGISICDILEFGGCQGYLYDPPCDVEPASVVLSGTSGNGLTVGDAIPLDITADIVIEADVALADWTPGVTRVLGAKAATSGQFSYALSIDAAGAPTFHWSANGSTVLSLTADTSIAGLAGDGGRRAIQVSFDPTFGGSHLAIFSTAASYAGPWTQLGTARVGAGTTSIFSSTSLVSVGFSGLLANPMIGSVYRFIIRRGVGGSTLALDIDPGVVTDAAQTSFTAATGQTVTVLRSGGSPTQLVTGEATWAAATYSTPANDVAPWYNDSYPESADALGFFIEEWTGLDNRHVERAVAKRHLGGQLGALGAKERVMKMNLIAFARNERAMEYQFRWLEATLGAVCSSCETSAMWLRRYCPTDLGDLWDGLVELREVGLVEGVTWESDLMDVNRCYIRRMSFTFAAGDPCMYTQDVDGNEVVTGTGNLATCLNNITLDQYSTRCRPTCSELSEECRTVYTYNVDPMGAMAPVVTLTNDDDYHSAPVRVIAYADPGEIGVDPNPCGLYALGEIYVGLLAPWSELIWDVSGRTVRYRDGTTGDEVGGWAFIGANDPPIPRYFTMPCGDVHVVMELASRCLYLGGTQWYSGATSLGPNPHYPTVSVTLQERLGCP